MNRLRRGTALLETALCLPLLVLLLGWAVDVAWLALVRQQLLHAAQAGTRIGLAGEAVPAGDVKGVRPCGGDGAVPAAVGAGIAASAAGVLRPDDLCLAAMGEAGAAHVYALRYTARPLIGMAPGWRRAVRMEARVLVHDAAR